MDEWIGTAIGKMHLHKITQNEVAAEMGIRRDHLNKILNGKEKPKGAAERVTAAIDRIIARRIDMEV